MTAISGEVVCLVLGQTLGIGKESEYEVAHSSRWEAAPPTSQSTGLDFCFILVGESIGQVFFFLPFCDLI